MYKEGSNHIVNGANFPFGLAVLRRCMGAGETEKSAGVVEMLKESGVVKFSAIIALKCFNISLELSLN